ncbi:MAG TPA: nitrate/nitrite transporter NrtS [Jatrophihabitantaceae bacterium]|nr:nitrate/nitrite transporter NrtS [Jatrophihabitantaceae bacterium]
MLTALVVGTVLFAINQLDTVLGGHADTGTWVKTGLTYLVPFCVANTGLLLGCHRRR